MPVSGPEFKQALASWASGVTIVTSRADTRVQGMTVSAFSSVSLDPPLILVCADLQSTTHELIQQSKMLSISVLEQSQSALSNRFASKQDEHRRFEGLECRDGATGCPRVPGAIAWLDCRVVQAVAAGDHVLYVAEVVELEIGSGEPLIYFRGRYARITPT